MKLLNNVYLVLEFIRRLWISFEVLWVSFFNFYKVFERYGVVIYYIFWIFGYKDVFNLRYRLYSKRFVIL